MSGALRAEGGAEDTSWVLRAQLGGQAAMQFFRATVGSSFVALLDVEQGYDSGIHRDFSLSGPSEFGEFLRVPLVGGAWQVRGSVINVTAFNRSDPPSFELPLVVSITPGRLTYSERIVTGSSRAAIPPFAVSYRVTVSGGPQPGDSVSVFAADGTLIRSDPVLVPPLGAAVPLAPEAAFVEFLPGVPSFIRSDWTFVCGG